MTLGQLIAITNRPSKRERLPAIDPADFLDTPEPEPEPEIPSKICNRVWEAIHELPSEGEIGVKVPAGKTPGTIQKWAHTYAARNGQRKVKTRFRNGVVWINWRRS